MAIDNGGPAFSLAEGARNRAEFGMSLLDYFASQALTAFLSNKNSSLPPEFIDWDVERKTSISIFFAKEAYRIADAMIAEKRRREIAP